MLKNIKYSIINYEKIFFNIFSFISSCTQVFIPYYDFDTIMTYVHDTITYSKVNGEEWQTPEETLELGTGDCEDFVILMLKIVNDTYDIKGDLIIFKNIKTGILHAVAGLDNMYYDVTNNAIFDEYPSSYEYYDTFSYDKTMFYVKYLI